MGSCELSREQVQHRGGLLKVHRSYIFTDPPQLVKLTLRSPDPGDASFFLPGDPSVAREAWQAKMGTCLPQTVL